MSQPDHLDIEGNHPVMVDGHPEPTQSALNHPSQSPQGESNFGDGSGPLFSIYSKISEEEDNKMIDRWQKGADGTLVFTGLFSVAVTTLLTVSIQDLRQNSQDTSAFYLANIYQILADPNVTVSRTPILSPGAIRTQFSPPRYAVWVNSLWSLSLVMSLTCALLATSLHQWARRYIRLTQPARCSPEKRARMRAFFAGGVDKMHVPWAVEALPALSHLSLILFFSGLVIFLLNVNHSVFLSVIWCIGLFSTMYGCITFMPMFRPDSPYYTPLSTPAAFIIVFTLTILIAAVKFLIVSCTWVPMALSSTLYYCFTSVWIVIRSHIRTSHRHKVAYGVNNEVPSNNMGTRLLLVHHHKQTWDRFMRLPGYMLYLSDSVWRATFHHAERIWTVGKVAEEITVKRSWEIDVGILEWTIGTPLGEDDSLEKFFDAIPGFLNSKLVNVHKTRMTIHRTLFFRLRDALNTFLRRTLSSGTVVESVKNRRLDIYLNVTNEIFEPYQILDTFRDLLRGEFGQLPQSIETAHTLARWRSTYSQDIARVARCVVVNILQSIQKRDDSWVTLARDELRLPERVLRENITRADDSVLLSILLHMTRQAINTDRSDLEILSSLSKFNIRKTLPVLQNEFCALWNQIVLEARREWHPHVDILGSIRHLYIALHQGTESAPTSFSAFTPDNTYILSLPSCYPLCNIATHHPNLTAVTHPTQLDDSRPASLHPPPPRPGNHPIPGGSTAPQQAERADDVPGLPSSAECAPPHVHGFPFPSLIADSTHMVPQVNVVSASSSIEPIQTVALDLTPRVTTEIVHLSRQPALSRSTSDFTARHDEPTPGLPVNEMGDISRAPTAALLAYSHHDIVPVSSTPL